MVNSWGWERKKKKSHTWQCINHTPGLSVLKAMTRWPFAGSIATSLRGTFLCGNGTDALYFPGSCPRTQKS